MKMHVTQYFLSSTPFLLSAFAFIGGKFSYEMFEKPKCLNGT